MKNKSLYFFLDRTINPANPKINTPNTIPITIPSVLLSLLPLQVIPATLHASLKVFSVTVSCLSSIFLATISV